MGKGLAGKNLSAALIIADSGEESRLQPSRDTDVKIRRQRVFCFPQRPQRHQCPVSRDLSARAGPLRSYRIRLYIHFSNVSA